MIVLNGNTLGKRQQELNIKVNEAASKNIHFDEVKNADEKSDVDRFFKIDLASKYKNIEYMIDILKSGDSLSISRVLKCVWLYDDEHSSVVNTDYLHHKIFPFMSLKMKKKTLSTISMHISNRSRAEFFFTYCMNIKLTNIALNFLFLTSESFKLKITQNKLVTDIILNEDEKEYLKNFIGNSFKLCESLLVISENPWRQSAILSAVSYLYAISNIKYLELLEKYGPTKKRLGIRYSKDILKKYKDRILKNPSLYLNVLHIKTVIRHSSCDNVKFYLVELLPKTCESFWYDNFYHKYKDLINIIPIEERFEYLKEIFTNKYPGDEFEMSVNFYDGHCYETMTKEQKEKWALQHIESQKEILGSGNDYMWYKFVNFGTAFVEIKKLIMITPDIHQRKKITEILVETAANQGDLEKVLNYYNDRHMNEGKYIREDFIDKIKKHHNVLEFDDGCWTLFEKILYSLRIFEDPHYVCSRDHKFIVLVYYIIHGKELSESLKKYIQRTVHEMQSIHSYVNNVCKDKADVIYQFLFTFFVNEIKKKDFHEYTNEVKTEIRNYLINVLDLMASYNKEDECPEIIIKYAKLDWDKFKNRSIFKHKEEIVLEKDLLKYLKQDASLTVSKLPLVKNKLDQYDYTLRKLLRKLKIYFSHDIAKDYINFFLKLLSESDPQNSCSYKMLLNAVYGIFQLADENLKVEFMMKYSPSNPKIDHKNISTYQLYIQEAICRFACYSRPPVPLTNMLMFMKGDYVHYCLPIFNLYMANLPQPLCFQFVETILNAPLSLQKHGLRLAFKCFNTENLKKVILNVWKKTKNVSYRFIIYKALYAKIIKEDAIVQTELFEILKVFTSKLHQDDHKDIFDLLRGFNLPKSLRGEYLEVSWNTVNKLPDKIANWKHKRLVVQSIGRNIKIVKEDFAQSIVDEHIHNIRSSLKQDREESEIKEYNEAKWILVACFLVNFDNNERLDKNLKITKHILKTCFDNWNESHNDVYVYKQFCNNFIHNLIKESEAIGESSRVNPLLNAILIDLQNALALVEIYSIVWTLRLTTSRRKLVDDGKEKLINANENDKQTIARKIIINIGIKIGKIVEEFVDKKIYLHSQFYEILKIIEDDVQDIICWDVRTHLNNVDINVLACVGLVNVKIPEAYLFALKILPVDCPENCENDYETVLSEIKRFENNDVQCTMYQKFMYSDFKRRKYI